MPRFNLALSLFLSLFLVSSATWVRLSGEPRISPELVAQESTLPPFSFPDTADNSPSEGSLGSSSLSQTDLISRQLFSDYIDLSSKGRATSANLANLADTYAKNILSLESASVVERSEISVIPDSAKVLQSYAVGVLSLRARYAQSMQTTYSAHGSPEGIDTSSVGEFMLTVSRLYKEAADELRALPVPVSAADIHLKLINNYLSSSEAAKNIASMSTDPIKAYTALNTQASKSQEEAALLASIQQILLTHATYQ